ncbi:MAG: CoA pyrophosphatase [Cyclobacteriaceae bacterium]
MSDNFISNLEKKLREPLPGDQAHRKMIPTMRNKKPRFKFTDPPKLGAVLILFYWHNNDWHFPLIQRPKYIGVHSGQIGLPGGKMEKTDNDLIATALRETEEEIGITQTKVEVIGALSEFYVGASNHQILPVIGYYNGNQPTFIPDNYEVAEVIEAPLEKLLDRRSVKSKEITISPGLSLDSPYFDISDRVVWGATAMMLSELVEVIKNE